MLYKVWDSPAFLVRRGEPFHTWQGLLVTILHFCVFDPCGTGCGNGRYIWGRSCGNLSVPTGAIDFRLLTPIKAGRRWGQLSGPSPECEPFLPQRATSYDDAPHQHIIEVSA